MLTRKDKRVLFISLAAAMFVLGGCADKNGNGVPDSFSKDAGTKANEVLDDAKNTAAAATKQLAAEAKPALKKAENEVQSAVRNPKATVENAEAAVTITPKVKTAIKTTDALDGTDIDVSTVGTLKVVRLDGKVKTVGQKKLAAAVAARSATGYKVENHLKVGG